MQPFRKGIASALKQKTFRVSGRFFVYWVNFRTQTPKKEQQEILHESHSLARCYARAHFRAPSASAGLRVDLEYQKNMCPSAQHWKTWATDKSKKRCPFVPYASPFVNNQPQESNANEQQTSSATPQSNRGQESGLMIYGRGFF
ncbi:MAG: hypothetical protein J6V91_02610 [Kiritimatiellae bacterium]|nr:hypothetical protein [Kiritimatiellia bacterium]